MCFAILSRFFRDEDQMLSSTYKCDLKCLRKSLWWECASLRIHNLWWHQNDDPKKRVGVFQGKQLVVIIMVRRPMSSCFSNEFTNLRIMKWSHQQYSPPRDDANHDILYLFSNPFAYRAWENDGGAPSSWTTLLIVMHAKHDTFLRFRSSNQGRSISRYNQLQYIVPIHIWYTLSIILVLGVPSSVVEPLSSR